jgi:hypothetical protein
VTTEPPLVRARHRLREIDRRHVPAVAARLDRLMSIPARWPGLEPNIRRILGALAIILLASAVAIAVIGS